MGQQQSAEAQKFLENFQRQYQSIKSINDSRFGEIQVFRNKERPQFIMLKTYWCKSQQDQKNCLCKNKLFKIFSELCEKLSQFDNKYLLKLLGYHANVSNQFCADFTKISIYFEYFDNTLEKEIEIRHQKSQLYQESDLWLILYSIASAGRFLEERNKYLGDIRPQNIMVAGDGSLKLIECSPITCDKSGFLRAYYNKEKAYLAPELLPFVQDTVTQPPPPLITYKTEIFSFGITLLECSTLISARSLYTYENNGLSLNFSLMNQMLEQIKQQGYSPTWYRMVRELIREKPEERPTFNDVMEVLGPFESQILNRQSFQLITQQQDQTKLSYAAISPTYQVQDMQPKFSTTGYTAQYYLPSEVLGYSQPLYTQPVLAVSPMKPLKYEELSDSKSNQVQFVTVEPQKLGYQQYQPQIQEYWNIFIEPYVVQQPIPQSVYEIQSMNPYQQQYIPSLKTQEFQSFQQPQPSNQEFQQQQYQPDDNSGLSDLDKKIQQALKSSQETAKRHYQTPTYF